MATQHRPGKGTFDFGSSTPKKKKTDKKKDTGTSTPKSEDKKKKSSGRPEGLIQKSGADAYLSEADSVETLEALVKEQQQLWRSWVKQAPNPKKAKTHRQFWASLLSGDSLDKYAAEHGIGQVEQPSTPVTPTTPESPATPTTPTTPTTPSDPTVPNGGTGGGTTPGWGAGSFPTVPGNVDHANFPAWNPYSGGVADFIVNTPFNQPSSPSTYPGNPGGPYVSNPPKKESDINVPSMQATFGSPRPQQAAGYSNVATRAASTPSTIQRPSPTAQPQMEDFLTSYKKLFETSPPQESLASMLPGTYRRLF